MKNQKLREVLGSRNFLASLLTVFLLTVKGLGVEDLPVETGEELYDGIAEIIAVVSAWIITPILTAIKRVSERNFDASYFTNSNFITAVVTVIGAIATVYVGEELWGTISLVLVNILNVLFQIRKTAKAELKVQELPTTPEVQPEKTPQA